MIQTSAKILNIEPRVLEALIPIIKHLSPNSLDLSLIERTLGVKINFHQLTNSLIIPNGDKEDIINLTGLTEEIYANVLPAIRNLYWDGYEIYLTNRYNSDPSQGGFYQTKTSVVMLYQIFEKLNDLFEIERNKGLGSMDLDDLHLTCLNPSTRKTYAVHNLGDVQTIFDLLGDGSMSRKNLLISLGLM
jgi:DNA gyrase/topoisomerase IV subunit B